MAGKLVNVTGRRNHSGYFYIGRKHSGMHFGNPFTHLPGVPNTIRVATRDHACDNFDAWIDGKAFAAVEPERRKWILDHLYLLENQDLGCFCYPKRCHGTSYFRLLNERRK